MSETSPTPETGHKRQVSVDECGTIRKDMGCLASSTGELLIKRDSLTLTSPPPIHTYVTCPPVATRPIEEPDDYLPPSSHQRGASFEQPSPEAPPRQLSRHHNRRPSALDQLISPSSPLGAFSKEIAREVGPLSPQEYEVQEHKDDELNFTHGVALYTNQFSRRNSLRGDELIKPNVGNAALGTVTGRAAEGEPQHLPSFHQNESLVHHPIELQDGFIEPPPSLAGDSASPSWNIPIGTADPAKMYLYSLPGSPPFQYNPHISRVRGMSTAGTGMGPWHQQQHQHIDPPSNIGFRHSYHHFPSITAMQMASNRKLFPDSPQICDEHTEMRQTSPFSLMSFALYIIVALIASFVAAGVTTYMMQQHCNDRIQLVGSGSGRGGGGSWSLFPSVDAQLFQQIPQFQPWDKSTSGYGMHNIDTSKIDYIATEELTDHISARHEGDDENNNNRDDRPHNLFNQQVPKGYYHSHPTYPKLQHPQNVFNSTLHGTTPNHPNYYFRDVCYPEDWTAFDQFMNGVSGLLVSSFVIAIAAFISTMALLGAFTGTFIFATRQIVNRPVPLSIEFPEHKQKVYSPLRLKPAPTPGSARKYSPPPTKGKAVFVENDDDSKQPPGPNWGYAPDAIDSIKMH